MRNCWKLAAVAGLMVALGGAARADWRYDAVAANAHGDFATAFRLYRLHAEHGTARDQYNIGRMYHNGAGVAKDYTEALKWYRLAAEHGDVDSLFELGLMYDNGEGVTKDSKEYLRFARLAAESGSIDAQSDLGNAYALGADVEKDYKESNKWLRRAAEQRDVYSQWALGAAYSDGRYGAIDYKEAIKWYRLAAEQGESNSQFNVYKSESRFALAMIYYYGTGVSHGVAQNYEEAAKWWRLLAEEGNAACQATLGEIYYKGEGVTQDVQEALKWYRLSAAQGNEDAKKFLSTMPAEGQGVSEGAAITTREIVLQRAGDLLVVPVTINNAITLKFLIDSGSSDVSIPSDVVKTLIRTGTLAERDFTGTQTYVLADGTKMPSRTFVIKTLKVGDIELKDVKANVASENGNLLLGQSFLGRFRTWAIDNTKQVLRLN